MKYQLIIATFLTISFFATASATASNAEDNTAIPEVIACESMGQCEMTKLDVLIQLDQQAEKVSHQKSPSHADASTTEKLVIN